MHDLIKDERFYPFSAEPLTFSLDALSPFISKHTMYFHYDKHYKGYINKLNSLLEDKPLLHNVSLPKLTQNENKEIRDNAGGVFNHSLYFSSLSDKPIEMSDYMIDALTKSFGSVDIFWDSFKKAGLDLLGSGYVWLAEECSFEPHTEKKIKIFSSPNQNTPNIHSHKLLLPIDVWEHSYYLDRQNRRDEYLDAVFSLINWKAVEERLRLFC